MASRVNPGCVGKDERFNHVLSLGVSNNHPVPRWEEEMTERTKSLGGMERDEQC